MKKIIDSVICNFILFAFMFIFMVGCKSEDSVNLDTVTDIDGNVYHSVTIGTQTWMKENLRVTKYRNGDAIVNVANDSTWVTLITGAQCTFNNTTNTDTIAKFGRLYNFYAVVDSRNIAPVGWHVASYAEWTMLTNYVGNHLGSSLSVAKAIASSTNWPFYTDGANGSLNNATGFSAFPSGVRNSSNGEFQGLGATSTWWCSDSDGSYSGWCWILSLYYNSVIWFDYKKSNGFSVRCVKD